MPLGHSSMPGRNGGLHDSGCSLEMPIPVYKNRISSVSLAKIMLKNCQTSQSETNHVT